MKDVVPNVYTSFANECNKFQWANRVQAIFYLRYKRVNLRIMQSLNMPDLLMINRVVVFFPTISRQVRLRQR